MVLKVSSNQNDSMLLAASLENRKQWIFLHRKATLAVIKVISISQLNFVMTPTFFFCDVLQEFYLTRPDLREKT